MVKQVVLLGAEVRGFERAAKIWAEITGLELSAKTMERVVRDVGRELAERREERDQQLPLARHPEAPPEAVVVECDGGRIRVREPGRGCGVHGEGWRETKNACLVRIRREVFEEDPQPEPPACFGDVVYVAKLLESEVLSGEGDTSLGELVKDVQGRDGGQKAWQAECLVRTILSSMAEAEAFGRQMAREAKRRRFDEARGRAFLGDGLAWNWSIWERHFKDYTPILDFTHVLGYLYRAAQAVHGEEGEEILAEYRGWMRACWRGCVGEVIEELRTWQERLGPCEEGMKEDDPRRVVARTITYLEHNRSRMNYPEYRRQGFPVTTAWMESVVKQINERVKGTEMFWNDPEGAEAILQVRAAFLCDDDRLARHLQTRPGYPFVRRPKAPIFPTKDFKS